MFAIVGVDYSVPLLPLLLTFAAAPRWTVVPTETTASFRAVGAGAGKVCWASGSKGTFARTLDGSNWTVGTVKGAEEADFRSLAVMGRDTAVALAIGDGTESRVFRTDDGGTTWAKAWQNPDPNAFYDALAFWDRDHGLMFGDPVGGHIPLQATDDGGRTWHKIDADIPFALPGESSFAASGRSIALSGSSEAWIVTGGGSARVFHSVDRGRTWTVAPTPLVPLTGSAGLFGILPLGGGEALAVGGDYEADDEDGNLLLSQDGGRTWPVLPSFRPSGLREAAIRLGGGYLLVGPSGTDLTTDGGKTWRAVQNPGALHSVTDAGGTVWGVGEDGLIARLG